MSEGRLDLTDFGDLVMIARAAVGVFPRVEIDPADALILFNEAKRAQLAEDAANAEIKRLQEIIMRDGGLSEEQIAAALRVE